MAVSLVSTGVTFPDSSTQITAATGFGFKNRIINGAMVIDQRNAGASVTPTSGSYTLDRWTYAATQSSKFSLQQNAGSVTPPVGFVNYLGLTSLSAYSIVTSDLFGFQQRIEGFNTSDLAWGTANAASVTLSFWVRSSLTGTFGGSVRNHDASRSQPFSYTISAANTWEYKTVTLVGDTSGTWLTTNGIGISLFFSLGAGSTVSNTPGVWYAGSFVAPTSATSVVGTNGATFYITGVQLEKGSTATSFDYRPYTTELQLCQRYLPVALSGNNDVSGSGVCMGTTTNFNIALPFKVPARTAPTGLTASSAGHFYIQAASGAGTVTAVTFGSGGLNGAYVTFAAPAGTTGQSCWIQTLNASANLYFNGCEL